MIQLKTMLAPADNSGAKRLMVIGISTKIGKVATIGDVVLCVVKGADSAGVVADHKEVGYNKIASLAREVI
ncbi:MAG: uL14 family ribosomal protein [Candidatus Woesebacteria bacterium]|nr:uL14 family ribosomal protein [Candidatus Woesebacteria bacterium]